MKNKLMLAISPGATKRDSLSVVIVSTPLLERITRFPSASHPTAVWKAMNVDAAAITKTPVLNPVAAPVNSLFDGMEFRGRALKLFSKGRTKSLYVSQLWFR
jgi:hypothetical protein